MGPIQPLFNFLFSRTFQTGYGAHPASIQFPLLQNIPDMLWGPSSLYSISSSPEHSRQAMGPIQLLFKFLFSRTFQTGSGAHPASIQFPLLQNIPDGYGAHPASIQFPLLQNIPYRLWGPPSPPFHGYRHSFPAVTRLDSDVHSPQSTAEVKNGRIYTSTLSVCLHEVTGNAFTLFVY